MLEIKNRDIRDLALASLGITVEASLKKACLEEIQQYPKSSWYSCEFRNCDLLLIYGGNEVIDKDNLRWTKSERSKGAIQSLISKLILPYFSRLPRLIVLRTRPGQQLNWHVDCNSE